MDSTEGDGAEGDPGWEVNKKPRLDAFGESHSSAFHARRRNVGMLRRDMLVVVRESFLPGVLKVSAAEQKCFMPFRSPCPHLRNGKSDALLRRRTLGVRLGRGGVPGRRPSFGPAGSVVLPGQIDTRMEEAVFEPLVLWEPGEKDHERAEPIEVDGWLCKWLREHQREGVQFVFDCVTGQKVTPDGIGFQGAILADDMGLGKTLQSIALIWLVLTKGFEGAEGPKIAKRVIVCCPTSLVFNWEKEIEKWLNGRVKCIACSESQYIKRDVTDFTSCRPSAPVLIISYETFRTHAKKFYGDNKCDLLICDEAHRLKNDATLTTEALNKLSTKRRVLLSGTPLQNKLDEYYAMANFTNEGILGNQSEFRKRFERPILASMEPDATDKQKEKGVEASQTLSGISNCFILRRTNQLLAQHLPTKVISVVCCKPTATQQRLYDHFLHNKSVAKTIESELEGTGTGKGGGMRVLAIIQSLQKLCNHPRLVHPKFPGRSDGGKSVAVSAFDDCAHLFPDDFDYVGKPHSSMGGAGRSSMRFNVGGQRQQQIPSGTGGCMPELSGKMLVLSRLLSNMRSSKKGERIVIVSNYTSTLDVISSLAGENGWPCVRLDGSMAVGKRRKLVEEFNDPRANQFIFLLSSKAGGCGLNLIGANRLVLFDPDWNPATDKQAAGRVWRDGQTRRCYVYRFLTSGTIEEKIFQRQLSKEGLQSVVVDDKVIVNSLSADELRDLFTLQDTPSSTHDGMRCRRCRDGIKVKIKAKEENLKSWGHFAGDAMQALPDRCLQQSAGDDVSFAFSMTIKGKKCQGDSDFESDGEPEVALSDVEGDGGVGGEDEAEEEGAWEEEDPEGDKENVPAHVSNRQQAIALGTVKSESARVAARDSERAPPPRATVKADKVIELGSDSDDGEDGDEEDAMDSEEESDSDDEDSVPPDSDGFGDSE